MSTALRLINHKFVKALGSFAFILLTVTSVSAQGSTDGSTPLGLSPGSPAGSYQLSDFDTVNLYNGSLNFRLPLFQVAGRGSAAYPITLHVEKKWTVYKHLEPGVGAFYYADAGWWSEEAEGWRIFEAGKVDIRSAHREQPTGYPVETVTRITFRTPDGTEYELRDQLTNGQPVSPVSGGFNRGRIFVTSDGSAATFVSDWDIRDDPYFGQGYYDGRPDGYMMLQDGTRFRVDDGKITWMRDRNGNKVSFVYDYLRRVISITDSLNRLVTVSYPSGTTGFTQISFKGFGGAARTIKIGQTNLANALRSGYTMQTIGQLFPELHGGGPVDCTVVNYIELPDGRRFQLQYNPYGELARLVLPTGGAVEYDYAAGLTNGAASGVFSVSDPLPNKYIYRRVIERRVYPDGGSGTGYASRTTYSRPETTTSNLGYVFTEQRNSSGTLLGKSQHYFYGSPRTSFSQKPTHYPGWKDGREYQTDSFDTNGSTILQRLAHTFAQRAPVSWWTGLPDAAPPNDPRLIETVTTIEPGGANFITKQTFGYDDSVPFNNQNNIKEYDFAAGAPGPLVRDTWTTFLTLASYTGTDVHIRNLPTQVSIYDSGGIERARTTHEYDNHANDTYHAPLVYRANISGFDAAFSPSYVTRGNETGTTNYLLINGSVTGSITSYAQYDQAGNIVKSIDGRGYATDFDFTDRYGSPDGEAQMTGGSVELAGQSSYAFATKVTNPIGHIGYKQFDYYLGRPIDAEDANGVTFTGHYGDALDRATQLIKAANQSSAVKSQTTFAYDDINRIVTITSDQVTFGDNILKSQIVYDLMGRPIESRQYETASTYISVKTNYDVLGRAYQTSNPYRAGETPVWTTTGFDALGRAVTVTAPDNAVVTTIYSGNSITVTDPAGKKRKSEADGLGRLKKVYEDPNALNYVTVYSYDVLDNLTTVIQDIQTRTFVYDSLKRLQSATNPESGTVSYIYDNNGNMTQRTDARGIVTTYAYDALNRNTTVNYSDTAVNPDVTRAYDGAIKGKGRFWYFYSGGDFANGSTVEHTATDSYDAMGRPLIQRQLFKTNGVWGSTYQSQRTYNLAGGVATQTYPSARTVSYAYDEAGRTSSFTGNLGDGTLRTYATGISYSPFGGLSKEQFGTDTALYHKLHYNIRGQLYDVRLSTVNDDLNWNRGAIVNYYSFQPYGFGTSGPDNNGNLLVQQHWVPNDDAISSYSFMQQNYDYDALNRLIWIGEYQNGATGTGSQNFSYDRYGNRNLSSASGAGINNKQFTINTANNRLGVPSGQSGTMTYDPAGNLTTDTYSGAAVTRAYDAENRMTSETQANGFVMGVYAYNAEGQRVRRRVNGGETWQIHGFDGELLAEYVKYSGPSSPTREYGYRNGELLVTANGRLNVAHTANGAIATASSAHTCCGFSPSGAINGNNRGPWGGDEGWNDATPDAFPDWIQVDFAGSKTIDEIDVYSLHDNYTVENTPTETQTFSLYGLQNFEVQYWNGSGWVTIPGGSVTGNNQVLKKFTFSPITTSKIRVWINYALGTWSRVVEIEAYGTTASAENLQWLVTDHLGTPRIVTDRTGSLAGIKRHDYLPFGEELYSGTGGRTFAQGYRGDNVRQKFTGTDRDFETGLDFFEARFYASTQGRFTSPDPLQASAQRSLPQTWNRYTYGLNNPLRYVDPDGQKAVEAGNGDVHVRTTIRTTQINVQERGGGQIVREATITVTESQTEFLNDKGEVIQSGPIETTANAVNTGNGARDYSQAQLDTMENVSKNIVEVSREKGFDATIALGIARTETHMAMLQSGESSPAKQTDVNPMQLSGTSGIRPTTDLRSNIAGAIDVFNRTSTGTLNQRLQDYNREAGREAYARTAEAHINRIRSTVNVRSGTVNLSQRPARFGFPSRPR